VDVQPVVKRTERAVEQSPPPSAEVKNEWSCTSVPLQAFMERTGTVLPFTSYALFTARYGLKFFTQFRLTL